MIESRSWNPHISSRRRTWPSGLDDLVGIVTVRLRPGGSIGYWLRPEMRVRGLMSEAVRAVVGCARDELRALTQSAMAWLTSTDELPYGPVRVLIAGTSGSGKSTLGCRLAAILDLPYIDLDALHHGANWTPRPQFVADVERFAAGSQWVTEWQYPAVRERLAERADLLILLDLPRWVVMSRVVRRTLSRRLRHLELWNGNVESPLRTIVRDRDHIIRWAWRAHSEHLPRVSSWLTQRPTLLVVRLRTPDQIEDCSPARSRERQAPDTRLTHNASTGRTTSSSAPTSRSSAPNSRYRSVVRQ
jgi:adenylate kinase family enzyme